MSWAWAVHNRLRLAFVHFETEHRAKVVAALSAEHDFAEAVALTVDGDVSARRRQLAPRKVRDSAWLFETLAPIS
jgi:hypothetical protein